MNAKRKLYEVRSKRVWPGRDEKMLTAWNGLMISAFAKVGAAFDDSDSQPRPPAADCVLQRMRSPDGRLFRSGSADGPAKLNGYLEDYAFLADALVTLYEATFDPKYLRAASELADMMLKHFADPSGPGFFFVAGRSRATHRPHQGLARRLDAERQRSCGDGALAAGEVARSARLRGEGGGDAARLPRDDGRAPRRVRPDARRPRLLPRADTGNRSDRDRPTIRRRSRALDAIRRAFRPNQVLAFHDPATGPAPDFIPLLKDKPAVDGKVTVYVCENFACQAPLVGAEAVERAFATPTEWVGRAELTVNL